MVSKTPFKVIHTSKTQFLEPNLVGFGRSIYDRRPWIKSGSKNLEKKKLEIFEVGFCNAVGTDNSSFQSLDLFNDGGGPFKIILNCRCWHIWKGKIWLKNLSDWGVWQKKSELAWYKFRGTIHKGSDGTPHRTKESGPFLKGAAGFKNPIFYRWDRSELIAPRYPTTTDPSNNLSWSADRLRKHLRKLLQTSFEIIFEHLNLSR